MKDAEYYRLHKELLEAIMDAQYRTSHYFSFDYSNICTSVYYYPTDKVGKPIIEKRVDVVIAFTRLNSCNEEIIQAIKVVKGINDVK